MGGGGTGGRPRLRLHGPHLQMAPLVPLTDPYGGRTSLWDLLTVIIPVGKL